MYIYIYILYIIIYINLCKQAFAGHVSTYSEKNTTKDCAKQKNAGSKYHRGAIGSWEVPIAHSFCICTSLKVWYNHSLQCFRIIPVIISPIQMATSIAMVMPESPGMWFKIHCGCDILDFLAWSSWLAAFLATAVNWSIRGLRNCSRSKEWMCVCVCYTYHIEAYADFSVYIRFKS